MPATTTPALPPTVAGRKSLSVLALVVAALVALSLSGCAALKPGFQEPEIQVIGLEPVPGGATGHLQFRIQLRVLNPNNTPLQLSGLYYSLNLAGHRIVSGTASTVPEIPAFGQADLSVDASANVMSSMMAAAKLMRMQGDTVPYELEARLGLRRSLLPYIKVRKSGVIRLN